jgi:Saccharopine dehydrogenase NADP binding domain
MSSIVVYGARGHTGTFVVRELARRGFTAIPAGRDDDLARLLPGAAAVINCAGPFLDTATSVLDAALRANVHYLDITAEQPSARATLATQDAAVCVIPAAGFFGGLADLLATAHAASAPSINIWIALDHWWPTRGTRVTGARNTSQRVVVHDGALVPLTSPATSRRHFAPPFGAQDMLELPLSEIITLHSHLPAREIRTHLNTAPLAELRDPATPPPLAIDEHGRSAQRFVMEVETAQGTSRISGQDIYAITAPLVVEAVARILDGRVRRVGTGTLGSMFDAPSFLAALDLTPMSRPVQTRRG